MIGTRAFFLALLALACAPASARAGLYLPDELTYLESAGACGIRADYSLSGSTLRIELMTAFEGGTPHVAARFYQPNSVGPMMRDVWIKSATLFSLGRFKPAKENGNGILETKGQLTGEEAKAFYGEMSQGAVEISIIFDGVMPTARLPVGLPSPLPEDVVNALETCWEKRS